MNHSDDHDPAAHLRNVEAGGIRWTIRPLIAPETMARILRDPDSLLVDPSTLVANSAIITMARVAPEHPGEPVLLLRRLNYGRLSHRVRDVFRRTRVERAFWHGLALEGSGVRTPRNVAVGVERIMRWPSRAYLVTEWIVNGTTLEQMLARGLIQRRETADLAELLARLHNNGFSHRDLKASNIIFNENRLPFLIDLDGIQRMRWSAEGYATRDLARFAWEFARYPQVLKWNGPRFLKTYCGKRHLMEARLRLERRILRPLEKRLAAGINYWKR